MVRNHLGFILLEVMAALTIFGLSVLLILLLFSNGLNSAKVTDNYSRAIIYAEEMMTSALLESHIEEGIKSGMTDDGYRWTVEIRPYDIARNERNPNTQILRIISKVRNQEMRREVRLETLKTLMNRQ